jgi:hypothetical protein
MEDTPGGNEMFGGIDFNQDVVFDITPTGEVASTKVVETQEEPETEPSALEKIIEANKGGKEPKEKEEDEESKKKAAEASAPSSPSDPITLFASALSESGAITADDEKIAEVKTYDDLVEVIKETIKTNEFADLDENAKQALEDIRNGVPIQVVKEHHNTQVQLGAIKDEQFIDAPSDDDEQLEVKQRVRKQLIIQSYLVNGYDQTRAEKMAQRSIDIGEDVEDAKTAVEDLKRADNRRIDTERANAQARKVEAERQIKKLEETVMGTEEILPGVPISEKLRRQVFDSMTKPVETSATGAVYEIQKERAKDPVAFDLRLHYLYALGLFKETPV